MRIPGARRDGSARLAQAGEPASPSIAHNRRAFLRSLTAAAAGAGLLGAPGCGRSPAPGRVLGANERITVGYIGIGGPPSNTPGMGLAHVRSQRLEAARNNIAQAAVCDVYAARGAMAKAAIGSAGVAEYADYRALLERKDIDAVVIATHDVWHAQITVDALAAGKHVYCEKPLTRYLDEAFRVHAAVKRTGKVFQAGVQSCSAGGWRKAAQLVQEGKLGRLVRGQAYYCRNHPKGEWNYTLAPGATAETVGWEAWLGPVKPKVPFRAEDFFRWRKFYRYSAGLVADLLPHRLHPLMVATGNPEFPRRVVCLGTRPVHADRQTPGALEREVPEHLELLAEFPSGLTLALTASSVSAKNSVFVLCGHQASLEVDTLGASVTLLPENEFAGQVEPVTDTKPKAEDLASHEKNWFDCIRSGEQPNAPIDLALRAQVVIALAEMAERLNVCCLFDEKTREVTTGEGRRVEPLTYG